MGGLKKKILGQSDGGTGTIDKGRLAGVFGYLVSFEFWMVCALLTFWFDASVTLIGSHYVGLWYEANPLILWSIEHGNFLPIIAALFVIPFTFFLIKSVWNYKWKWVRYFVRGISWGTTAFLFYFGPWSWLSFIYL